MLFGDRDLDTCGADHVHDTSLTLRMPTRQGDRDGGHQASARPPVEDLGLMRASQPLVPLHKIHKRQGPHHRPCSHHPSSQVQLHRLLLQPNKGPVPIPTEETWMPRAFLSLLTHAAGLVRA